MTRARTDAEPDDRPERGRLFVVATPIGNLGDMTLRAVEVLRSVTVIAAEDTRLTRRLLDRYGISTAMVSYHARSGPGRLRELLERLERGEDMALVTDAGTPGVSDPGEDLVDAWLRAGGTTVPIPGASALVAAISATAMAGPRWSFEGFLPRTGAERRERIARIAADPRGSVLYEAPGRIVATLLDLAAACGAERTASVCRELTKLHEEIVRSTLGELADRARSGELTLRGEFVIIVGARGADEAGAVAAAADDDRLAAALLEVERQVAAGSPRGGAARAVAAATGVPRRRLYAAPDRATTDR